jgi:hypothetical protein
VRSGATISLYIYTEQVEKAHEKLLLLLVVVVVVVVAAPI